MASHPEVSSIRRRLLRWYDAQRRDLPWRAGPGERPDPYKVWVSEVMLQQTTVATVKGHFGDFVARFPTLQALARADRDAVLHAWQGLGYYARARNLHKCARVVADDWGGRFPETEDELKTLPGIGDYTAAAVAAIAFGKKATPVDSNVERVTARIFAVGDPLPGGKRRISELAASLTPASKPRGRPGDFAQAMMDLGATLCRSRAPDCGACPLRSRCLARAGGAPERFPVKPARKARPVRHGMVFWAVRDDGNVLLRQRPDKGLLGGMMEIPSTEWRLNAWTADEAVSAAPVRADWRALDGVVSHTFTHFHLQLVVLAARVGEGPARGKGNGGGKAGEKGGVWCPPGRFSDHALPTVMKKVARHAQDAWKGEGTDYSS